jgi:hypothetical protein
MAYLTVLRMSFAAELPKALRLSLRTSWKYGTPPSLHRLDEF